jgi:hypothetical protein
MRAYKVYGVDSFYSVVCFAETPSKAKGYAFRFLDAVEGYEYTELRARRIKRLDKYYKQDKKYLDWYIDEDRLTLVKVGGFTCEETSFECDTCIARKYCDTIKDYLNE